MFPLSFYINLFPTVCARSNRKGSEKKLQAVRGCNAVQTTVVLYFDDVINDGVPIKDTYYGALVSPSSESRYYFDTVFSMIASVEDLLLIENKKYTYFNYLFIDNSNLSELYEKYKDKPDSYKINTWPGAQEIDAMFLAD